jgi:antitoxin FitA
MNMPTTLTLKNIPDAIYDRLKLAAQEHRRSMNNEAIVCLEAVLLAGQVTASERLDRARWLRSDLPAGKFNAADIDLLKQSGRPSSWWTPLLWPIFICQATILPTQNHF